AKLRLRRAGDLRVSQWRRSTLGAKTKDGRANRSLKSEGWSRRWDSNPQPPVYKTGALPLSYAGGLTLRLPRLNWEKTENDGGSRGTRTPNQLIKSQLLYH